jgi:hypothetical protein
MRGPVPAAALLAASTPTACGGAPPMCRHPPPPATIAFSRELNASCDQAWSAVTYVAGSTFFNIRNFDKRSGLMTLTYSDFRDGVGQYLTCGKRTGGTPALTVITPEQDSVLNHLATCMTLSGTANITVRSAGRSRTTVQISSSYDFNAYQDLGNRRLLVGHRRFPSREPASQTVQYAFQTMRVACQPSYKIENNILTEVAARL